MEIENVICHIISLNPVSKKKIIDGIDIKKFHCVDLDNINNFILKNKEMDKMFRQYHKLKTSKNDKFKQIDKKMTEFWENNFINLLYQKIPTKKKTILIGNNSHYRLKSKKIKLPTYNKFILKQKVKNEIKQIIKYNLDNYYDDIINGSFPINHLDYDFLFKKINTTYLNYKKAGYIEKSVDELHSIFNLIIQTKIKGDGLWVSLKQPYNIASLIHPNKNDEIIAYTEPIYALLDSFDWKDNELIKNYKGNKVKIIEKNNKYISKLKTRRFLYFVSKETFIPYENGNNVKFFSQAPVAVLNKEKIPNVHEKFKKMKIF